MSSPEQNIKQDSIMDVSSMLFDTLTNVVTALNTVQGPHGGNLLVNILELGEIKDAAGLVAVRAGLDYYRNIYLADLTKPIRNIEWTRERYDLVCYAMSQLDLLINTLMLNPGQLINSDSIMDVNTRFSDSLVKVSTALDAAQGRYTANLLAKILELGEIKDAAGLVAVRAGLDYYRNKYLADLTTHTRNRKWTRKRYDLVCYAISQLDLYNNTLRNE